MFLDLAGKGYKSEDYLMSEKADDLWKDELEFLKSEDEDIEDTYDARKEWAKTQEREAIDDGDPSMHFSDAELIEPDSFLVHFTDSDPMDIVNQGFKGRDVWIIGLTTHYKPHAFSGDLALAYLPDDIASNRYVGFGKYGKNAVLFRVKQGARAYHWGDEENQVIFDVDDAYDLWPIYGDSDSLSLYDPDPNGGELLVCDRDQDCIEKMIQHIKSLGYNL